MSRPNPHSSAGAYAAYLDMLYTSTTISMLALYPSTSGTYITAIIQLQLNFGIKTSCIYVYIYEVDYFNLPAVLAGLNPTSIPSVLPVGKCSYSFCL